jgi:hypothetical protein
MFYRLKNFVEENSLKKTETEIDQSTEVHLVNQQRRLCEYIPEAVSDKYAWMTDPFRADSLSNITNFSLSKKIILAFYLILLKSSV